MFDYSGNPAQNRVLVTTDPKDPARWLKEPATQSMGSSYVTENGKYGWVDGYKSIQTGVDVNSAKPNKKVIAIEGRLRELLEGMPGEKPGLTDTQIRAAANTLAGAYGPEVTLTGLDPALKEVISRNLGEMQRTMEGHIKVDPAKLHLHSLDEHPGKFIVKDGLMEEVDWKQNGSSNNRNVDDLTEKQLQDSDKLLKERWNRGHPERERNVAPKPKEVAEDMDARRLERAKEPPAKKGFSFKNPFARSKSPDPKPGKSKVPKEVNLEDI